MKIVISSGHGDKVRGAAGSPIPPYLDERNEAVRVVDRVYDLLKGVGVDVIKFHDHNSTTQNQNLNAIVNFHNAQGAHDLDVSVHFNANVTTNNPVGTECLYVTQKDMADKVAEAISNDSGLIDRGPKKSTDLFFLNNTREPAILVETCFVDSKADCDIYRAKFEEICTALAETISGQQITPPQPEPIPPEPEPIPPQPAPETPTVNITTTGAVKVVVNGQEITPPVTPPIPPAAPLFQASGKCSWFGGPADTGVSPSEGLAFIYSYDQAPYLFLAQQPPGTTGLARRLNPDVYYVACRWDYAVTSKTDLARKSVKAAVRAKGKELLAWPADWGPHQDTGRVADLSPGLMRDLALTTDDAVEVIYPAPTELIA